MFGCDDTAKSEFLNKRKAKGNIAAPGQSQSNLWFVDPERLDHLGPPLGRGAVWLDDAVPADAPSDPFLFAGFARRVVHLAHGPAAPVTFTFEVDRAATGSWQPLREVAVPAHGASLAGVPADLTGEWLRVRTASDATRASVGVSLFESATARGSSRTRSSTAWRPSVPPPRPAAGSAPAAATGDLAARRLRGAGHSAGRRSPLRTRPAEVRLQPLADRPPARGRTAHGHAPRAGRLRHRRRVGRFTAPTAAGRLPRGRRRSILNDDGMLRQLRE